MALMRILSREECETITHPLARRLAECLEDDYEIVHSNYANGSTRLDHERFGFILSVITDGAQIGRVKIRASLGELEEHFDGYRDRWPIITVDPSRPAHLIAQDILRRLEPQFKELQAALLLRHRSALRYRRQMDAAAERIREAGGDCVTVRLTPGSRAESRHYQFFDRFEFNKGHGFDLKGELNESRILIEHMSMSLEDAEAVLALLRDRHRETPKRKD
jgi:hypothetical protein